jgi:hypothetical protein
METPAPQAPQSQEPKPKWYWSTPSLVLAFAIVGPLALPFLWMNPRMTVAKKVVWTVTCVVLTYFMATTTLQILQKVLAQYRELGLIQ